MLFPLDQPLHAKSAKFKTGGVHTKFHSNTSSSSSSSDSEEMDIDKNGKQSCTPSPKSTSSATGNGPVSSEMPSRAPNMDPPNVASSLKNNIGNLKQTVLGRGRGHPLIYHIGSTVQKKEPVYWGCSSEIHKRQKIGAGDCRQLL